MVTGRSSGWAGTRHSTMRGFAPHTPHTLSRAPLRRRAPFAWLTHCVRSSRSDDRWTMGGADVGRAFRSGSCAPSETVSSFVCRAGNWDSEAGSWELATGNRELLAPPRHYPVDGHA